jgi:hypothetical protein
MEVVTSVKVSTVPFVRRGVGTFDRVRVRALALAVPACHHAAGDRPRSVRLCRQSSVPLPASGTSRGVASVSVPGVLGCLAGVPFGFGWHGTVRAGTTTGTTAAATASATVVTGAVAVLRGAAEAGLVAAAGTGRILLATTTLLSVAAGCSTRGGRPC